jgi:acyl-CoA reductase-like NAD-dependent aldehyde dehydrogenase
VRPVKLEPDEMTMIRCISPVDGSVYAERPAMSYDNAAAAVARARKAQKAWAARPLEDRVQLVLKGVERLNQMAPQVVEELAWQMGRPVKYGGEFKGFNERSNYVATIAADALAPVVVESSASFERYIEREPHGVVFVIAPWNYPYMTALNTIAPALMAGNSVVLKHASQTLLVGERFVQAFNEAGVPEDVFMNVFLVQFHQFHGLCRRRAQYRACGCRYLHRHRPGAWRQGSGLCDGRCRHGCGRRYADGRRDLQFGPMLLRYRAHLCERKSL